VKPDMLTIAGFIVSAIAILGGQALEGGHIGSITQPTAALIVFGGTLGACLVAFPKSDFVGAIKDGKKAILTKEIDYEAKITTLVELAKMARKGGLISLEAEAEKTDDAFLKQGLLLAVDGSEPKQIQDTLETIIGVVEHDGGRNAKVWESAGAFAPTVGILGAVLGLIHVMENLDDPSNLGSGIAVAFVATVYGVAAANLLFLPFASKLKLRIQDEVAAMELVLTGILSIVAGENVRLVEEKLRAALPHGGGHGKADAKAEKEPAAAAA
tara:strand:- start:65 stop:874 length:810 start_codon:yes stop_codon:yes gene_type:complete